MSTVKGSPFVLCRGDSSLEPAVEVGLLENDDESEHGSRSVLDMLRQFSSSPSQDNGKLQRWSDDLERVNGIVTVKDLQNLSATDFKECCRHWDSDLVSIVTRYRDLMFHEDVLNKLWWEEDDMKVNHDDEPVTRNTNMQPNMGQYFMIESCFVPGYILEAPSEAGLSPSLVPQSRATSNTIWTYNATKKQVKCAATKRVLDMVMNSRTNRVPPGATVILWNENLGDNQKWEIQDGRLIGSRVNSSQQNKNADGNGTLVLDVYLGSNSTADNPFYLLRMWPEDGSIAQQWNFRPAAPPAHAASTSVRQTSVLSSQLLNLGSPNPANLLQNSMLTNNNILSPNSSLLPPPKYPISGANKFILPPTPQHGTVNSSSSSPGLSSPMDNNSNRRKIGFYLESFMNPGWVLESSHLCQGAVVHLVPKKDYTSDAQKWRYDSQSGTVSNLHDASLVLDITRGSSQPGVSICMWPRNRKAHQSWRFVPSQQKEDSITTDNNNNNNDDSSIITIQTKHSSRHVLQAEPVQSDQDILFSPVFMWPYSGQPSQKWKLIYS